MRRIFCTTVVACLLVATTAGTPITAQQDERAVDVAICLDISGSMGGLIDAARQRLWSIVNLLATAEPTPKVRVALLTFGHPDNGARNGWVRVESPLTEDLDQVSARLFALEAKGGAEFVGRVIKTATEQLDWSESPDALKMIVVAGNESTHQDPEVLTHDTCLEATRSEITVSAIYCGNVDHPDALTWEEVARMGQGTYATINHKTAPLYSGTPFDEELAKLSASLNRTYVPLGAAGREKKALQAKQDMNAGSVNSAIAASPAVTKAGSLYKAEWDLIDALDSGQLTWDALDFDDLPQELRELSLAELEAHVEQLRFERNELRARIMALAGQRNAELASREERLEEAGQGDFGRALGSTIREQAERRGFRFPEPERKLEPKRGR